MTGATSGTGAAYFFPENLSSSPVFIGVCVARSSVYCVMFCRYFFILFYFFIFLFFLFFYLFFFAIVLSVLPFTASD
jgi:hypothetical protein